MRLDQVKPGVLYVYAPIAADMGGRGAFSNAGRPAIALATNVDWDYDQPGSTPDALVAGGRVAVALYHPDTDGWMAAVCPARWLHPLRFWTERGGDVVRAPVSRWPLLSRQALERDRRDAVARLSQLARTTRTECDS